MNTEADDVQACKDKQRLCLAKFMDSNPGTFRPPRAAANWQLLLGAEPDLGPDDQAAAERAMSMLLSVYRDAQSLSGGFGDAQTLEAALQARSEASVEPDRMAMALDSANGLARDESDSFARAVSVFKQALSEGLVTVQQFYDIADQAFSRVEGNAPLVRSLVETAKEMVRIQVETLLGVSAHGESV